MGKLEFVGERFPLFIGHRYEAWSVNPCASGGNEPLFTAVLTDLEPFTDIDNNSVVAYATFDNGQRLNLTYIKLVEV